MVNIIHLNTLLGIMMMVLLDHYIYLLHKQLDILINLKKIKSQCLLWLNIYKFKKIIKNIWKKIKELINIHFQSKTTFGDNDDKYIKTKIKAYKDSINTSFYHKNGSRKILEEKVPHKYLSIITLDSVIYAAEKYYPGIFLEEWKYMKENTKTKNYIDMELESESNTDTGSDSDIDNEE